MKKHIAILLVLAALLSSCKIVPADGEETTDRGSSSPTESVSDSTTDTGTDAKPPIDPDTSRGDETNPPSPPIVELSITEVMPNNENLVLGHENDWVEIYNPSDAAVTLEGYYLTDELEKPMKLPLNGRTIGAGEYKVIELDETAPFALSSLGETVYLTASGGTVISSLTFGADEDGCSFGAGGALPYPTPGQANTQEGYFAYLDSLSLPDLIISEVLSSNGKYLEQDGEYYDIIEVQNRSDSPISLSGYSLSDKRKEPSRYVFPNVTLGAGECYVVFCSGDATLGEDHASFKISASGERVYLSKDGAPSDVLIVPADLRRNESYGRDGNRLVYFDPPTPGEKNGKGYASGIASPQANQPSGLYDETIKVTFDGESRVFFTTDGSKPSIYSQEYKAPIAISGVTTIRAVAFDGERVSSESRFTYIIDKTHELPIVSIAIPQDSLTGSEGVLNHASENYEHEAVLTLIEGGKECFSVPFGFRLHGNDSRLGEKQNFSLRFRSEYGVGKLKYKLFDDRDIDEFNSILLKGGSEDFKMAMMRDEVSTAIANGVTGVYTQAMRPCVLYLGGEYWGVYYIRERFSADYVADHLGVNKDSVDLLDYFTGNIESGDNADYRDLLAWAKKTDMTKEENYDALCRRVDIVSLMDWYICRSFVGDKDLANIRFFRSIEADGKWRWCFYDLDWSIFHDEDEVMDTTLRQDGNHVLILSALASEKGKDAFLSRYGELMRTALSEERILSIIDGIASSVESEMARDRERWGRSLDGWYDYVDGLREYFKDGKREEWVKADIAEYFGLSAGEMERYFG